MSSYIYIKNFYLEEIQKIVQNQINSNYSEDSPLEVEILMKNSRTYFIRFNEKLAIEEILDWMKPFLINHRDREREVIVEGYLSIDQLDYKFYSIQNKIYAINSENKFYQIEDFEELIPEVSENIVLKKTEIPIKNIHSMNKIKFHKPKKKWWKFW